MKLALDPESVKHVLEIAGLGALAVPVLYHLSKAEDRTDKAMGATELAGLGTLAVPSTMHLLGH